MVVVAHRIARRAGAAATRSVVVSDKARWTVMIYMAGDNNLSDAAERDLVELRRVGSTAEVNVVVEVDHAGPGGSRRIHIQKDGAGEVVEDLGETDSGDPATLARYIEWASARFPAERYALVLWNHGGGWEPDEMDRVAQAVGAAGFGPGEARERSSSSLGSVFFRSSLETIFRLPDPEERAICSDDGTGHSLDMVELGRVLEVATARLGQPLDLVGMDACLMSNIEVAYQVAPYARYLVASEEIEPNQGWPYDAMLGALIRQPELPTASLATGIVEAYLAFYDGLGKAGVSQAALDLARLAELSAPLDALADALTARMPGAARQVWDAQRGSTRFYNNTLWDIAHFCAALEALGPDAEVAAAAAAVRAALSPGPDRPLLASGVRGDKLASCGGLSIYFQPYGRNLSRYYGDVRFAADHRWPTLLEAYHAS